MAWNGIVSIFCVVFVILPQLASTQIRHYYDADTEEYILREWYDMVRTPLVQATAMQQLENEARDTTGKLNTNMNVYLERAKSVDKSVSGLTRAECLVVLMYTDDASDRAFYREFNQASMNRNWRPYRVYSTLLMTAMWKLIKIDPIPQNAILYRGIPVRVEPPTAKRIYWKAITSTSLKLEVAQRFAGYSGTIMEFKPPESQRDELRKRSARSTTASVHAARVRLLSRYPGEDEVLLYPFEAFDFLSADGRKLYFSVSSTQPYQIGGQPGAFVFRSSNLFVLNVLFVIYLVAM